MSEIKDRLKQAYDKDAERRDSGYIDQWKESVRQSFIDILKGENKQKLLELGAGPGRDSVFFKENGFNVLATDLSQGMIDKCLEKGLNAKVVDFYDLSVLNQTFDAIYSMNVLLHVPRADLKSVLESISNALDENGIFFYGVYGGIDSEETIIDQTKMNLPRFFSFLSSETLKKAVSENFEILSFDEIDIQSKRGLVFQSLILKKR